MGSNYVCPYESNRIMAELVRQAGGAVLDEIHVFLSPQPSDLNKAVRGLSLASVLLLVALGLAITYGAMGVINEEANNAAR